MKKLFIFLFPVLFIAVTFSVRLAVAADNKALPKDYDLQFQGAINMMDSKLVASLLFEDNILKPDLRLLPFIRRAPLRYVAPTISADGSYRGDVFNRQDRKIVTFYYRPANSPKEKNGSIVVAMPYHPSAKTIKIYDPKDTFLFDIDVSAGSACNNDGVCDDQGAESYATCPSDCAPCIINGVCVPEYGETTALCPKDCPPPPKIKIPQTPVPATGGATTGSPLKETLFSWWIVAAIFAGLLGADA